MRILVDGDGCPVISIITKAAAEHDLELIVYTDLNHQHQLDYGTLKVVDQGFQSVDMVPVSYTHLTLPTNREV